jgi:hypothetical protein
MRAGMIYDTMASKGLGWAGGSQFESGMSSGRFARWSLSWLLVSGAAPTGALL